VDRLRIFLDTFTAQDVISCRNFLRSQTQKDNSRELELYDILISGREGREKGKDAYHAVRKRLVKKLTDYINLKLIQDDPTNVSAIVARLNVVRHLFNHNEGELAWYFLNQAEKSAIHADLYTIRHAILMLQIENAHRVEGQQLEDLLIRRRENKALMEEEENAEIAAGLIRQALRQAVRTDDARSIGEVVQEVLAHYGLNKSMIRRPRLLYNILYITRSEILARKDYFTFGPYVIEQYKILENAGAFHKHNHLIRLNFLYMIAHVLYRNRDFHESGRYIEMLTTNMTMYNHMYFSQFHTRSVMLQAAVLCYTGRLEESIGLLREVFIESDIKHNPEERVKAVINLSIYYFMDGKHGLALRLTSGLGHTDRWYEKRMGREWLFKKNLMEVIALYDTGSTEPALDRLRSVERNFHGMLQLPPYQRGRVFIEVIRHIIERPHALRDVTFASQVRKRLVTIPEEQEDLQAMAFFSWIKSKLSGMTYYEALLDTVGRVQSDLN